MIRHVVLFVLQSLLFGCFCISMTWHESCCLLNRQSCLAFYFGQGSERVHLEEARLRPVLSNHGGMVTEGVLEVKHAGKWRHVCNHGWDLSNSRVVCGMLGFPAAEDLDQNAYR